MYKPKVGIIGCGGFGNLHSSIITKLGIFDIIAFADINFDAALNCFRQFNAKYPCQNYRKIIDDREIDIVYVCTTHDMHFPIAMDAIVAGKHIFMEKPLAMTVEQCNEIKKALKGTGLKLMVGHKMRFAPNLRKAKNEIAKPIMLVGQMIDNRWPDTIWQQDPLKGGGNVFSQGCHMFDIITYLAGDWPDTIYAEGGTLTHTGTDTIDNIVSTIRFRNGVIASITIGDSGYNNFTSKTMLQIFTGNSCINLSNSLYRYNRYHSGQSVEEIDIKSDYSDQAIDPQGLYAEALEFYDCIINDRQPLVGVNEGANAVEMVNAAFNSIRTGCVQKMENTRICLI